LCALYSAVDVMVVPSRQEAFGQTASEAQACGTPVVAFDIGGLPDIIEHHHTGYLAKAFDTEDLANGILLALENSVLATSNLERQSTRNAARQRAVAMFSNTVVASQYKRLYDSILDAREEYVVS
jgi:glycosyltransferase involved in cell wall biosynthesis